ncbi:MAG TPA: hypothetical protein VIP09_16430 [Dehalococcoidia bacterium]
MAGVAGGADLPKSPAGAAKSVMSEKPLLLTSAGKVSVPHLRVRLGAGDVLSTVAEAVEIAVAVR